MFFLFLSPPSIPVAVARASGAAGWRGCRQGPAAAPLVVLLVSRVKLSVTDQSSQTNAPSSPGCAVLFPNRRAWKQRSNPERVPPLCSPPAKAPHRGCQPRSPPEPHPPANKTPCRAGRRPEVGTEAGSFACLASPARMWLRWWPPWCGRARPWGRLPPGADSGGGGRISSPQASLELPSPCRLCGLPDRARQW